MKRSVSILVGIIVFIGAACFANAQDQSRRALAEELLNVVQVKETTEKAFTMIQQVVDSQLEKMKSEAGPGAKSAEASTRIDKIMGLVKQEFSWEKMKDEYINLYAETFTDAELKDIITFYKTPAGQAFIKKQPDLMKRSMEVTQKRMAEIMPKIQAMTKELEESIRPSAPPQPATK
jgi:hypothetical protein